MFLHLRISAMTHVSVLVSFNYPDAFQIECLFRIRHVHNAGSNAQLEDVIRSTIDRNWFLIIYYLSSHYVRIKSLPRWVFILSRKRRSNGIIAERGMVQRSNPNRNRLRRLAAFKTAKQQRTY